MNRLKLVLSTLLVIAVASAAAAPVEAQAKQNDDPRLHVVSFYLGGRGFDEDDWEPLENQGMFGLEYAYENAESPIGFEIGLAVSADEDDVGGIDVEAAIAELYGGIHKSFGSGTVRPVIGAGLALVRAEIDVSIADESDSSIAAYAHGGVGFMLSKNVSLGVDARFLFGSEIEFAGIEGDADYGQLALVLGVGV